MTPLETVARDIAWELYIQFGGPLTVLTDERYRAMIVLDANNNVIFAKQAH